MLIGSDFEKIKWEIGEWVFLEPNALIGDTLLAIVAFCGAIYCRKQAKESDFTRFWERFFWTFGLGVFVGGLGHFFFEYWGVAGKYFSWFAALLSVYFLERAMLSLLPNQKWKTRWVTIAAVKLVLFTLMLGYVISTVDLATDQARALMIPSISTAIGMILCLVVLGLWLRQKKQCPTGIFVWAVIALLPSAFFQFMKISLAPWMDRNDLSHILLLVTMLIYLVGIRRVTTSPTCLNQTIG